MDDHGKCPHCAADLNGGSIWQTFYDQAINGMHYRQNKPLDRAPTEDEAIVLADDSASMYGATRTKGQWGREIGIYCMGEDRIAEYQCPDCEKRWPR